MLLKTNSANPDFKALVNLLDRELAERDGSEHSFYDQFNKIDDIKYALVAYDNGKPVACGAIKAYSSDTMEIKRMYTLPAERGKGFAGKLLNELESWAASLCYSRCILETGKRQPEAISVYRKNGYQQIPNYGQYEKVENSLCFEKTLNT